MRSKLLSLTIGNLGCIDNNGLHVDLDNILCLVGDNNSGKSTVLRAYELAVGTQIYEFEKDYCKHSKGENSFVEISVHIPEGTGNIAEKWKIKLNDLLVVKSRWEWDKNSVKIRKTFNPEINDYSDDGNAAGLDNVFNSRLPIPFRIGALENPQAELKNLLKLIVDPIAESLKRELINSESEISRALAILTSHAIKPVEEQKANIETINDQITNSHNKIFPNLSIDINIGMSELKIDPIDALVKGSKLNIKEYDNTVDWELQGTGSQRALFWSLLQVRSKLQAIKNAKAENDKRIKTVEKEIKKLEGERDKSKTDSNRLSKQEAIDTKLIELEKYKVLEPNGILNEKIDELNLPGYMLLIDEPEIALHPNGIRAASEYLYELANDNSWQVMLTTHSPLFINPFVDHTTIVRLSRNNGNPNPKTYKSDDISFTLNEIENLKLLNSFDQNLSEMFFGQYPLIVEGDTEFASFVKIMQLDREKYSNNLQPIIIRARGKFTIIPLIKMLSHFKVDFAILHDSDYPINKQGAKNNAWTANEKIYDAIKEARKDGIRIVHRTSLVNFEVAHSGIKLDENGNYLPNSSANKPWEMFYKIIENPHVKTSVELVFDELINRESKEEEFGLNFNEDLNLHFKKWVEQMEIKDTRFNIS